MVVHVSMHMHKDYVKLQRSVDSYIHTVKQQEESDTELW